MQLSTVDRERTLGYVQWALFALFVVSLGLYISRTLTRAIVQWHDRGVVSAATERSAAGPSFDAARFPADGASRGPTGVLAIPRLGLEATIRPGVDTDTLEVAVGHIPGTSDTVWKGNMGFAAHRDTLFRPLRNARVNDRIWLITAEGTFNYRITKLFVVDPEDVWVLEPTVRPTLTLVTCYPFSYVGPAPRRFIVRAERE